MADKFLSSLVGGSPIKSIQRGVTSAGLITNSIAISEVNVDKTTVNFLNLSRQSNDNVNNNLFLSDSTTIILTRVRDQGGNNLNSDVSWEVIEYV